MSIPKIVIGRDMPVFKPCQTMLNKIMNAGGFLIQIPSSPQGPVNCLKVFFTRVARIKIVNQKNCCLNSSMYLELAVVAVINFVFKLNFFEPPRQSLPNKLRHSL